MASSKFLVIFDSNLWIKYMIEETEQLFRIFHHPDIQIFLTSYGLAEILRVFRRIGSKIGISPQQLEQNFWEIVQELAVELDISGSVGDRLLEQMRSRPEILMIASLLELEPKDVPYIVSAFQKKAALITEDKRSIVVKRKKIQMQFAIKIMTIDEFSHEIFKLGKPAHR